MRGREPRHPRSPSETSRDANGDVSLPRYDGTSRRDSLSWGTSPGPRARIHRRRGDLVSLTYTFWCLAVFAAGYTVTLGYTSVFYHRGFTHGGLVLQPWLARLVVA